MFKKCVILIICTLCASLAYGCAQYHENGQVSHHISMKTIVEGVKQGKLIVNEEDSDNNVDQTMLKSEKGQILVYGNFNLDKHGTMEDYYCKFSAIFDKSSQKILKAEVNYKLIQDKAENWDGELTKPFDKSYGNIKGNKLYISVSGPYWLYSEDRYQYRNIKPDGDQGALVEIPKDIFALQNGEKINAKIYLGVISINPLRQQKGYANDRGTGVLTVVE